MKHLSKILIASVIFGFVFSGLLNITFYIAGRNPYELFLIGLFILLTALSVKANDFTLNISKIDYCFIIYFISILFFPILFNNYEIVHHGGDLHVLFVSVKIYLVYRIIKETLFLSNFKNSEKYIFDTIIFYSIVAGFIGVLRLLEIPGITAQIDYIWPTEKYPYRMTSTMSGINGGAIFFSLVSIIAIHLYSKTSRNTYLFSIVLLSLFVILTGSLTGIILLTAFYIYYFYKNFKFKIFVYTTLAVSISIVVLFNLFPLRAAIDVLYDERIERRVLAHSGQTILPRTLEFRYLRWDDQIRKGFEKPIFGHAVSTVNNQLPNYSITHNYYIYLFLYTGLTGLFVFLLFYFGMVYKLYHTKHKRYMLYILIFIFVAQGTQITLNYGGISEMLGVLIYLNKDIFK